MTAANRVLLLRLGERASAKGDTYPAAGSARRALSRSRPRSRTSAATRCGSCPSPRPSPGPRRGRSAPGAAGRRRRRGPFPGGTDRPRPCGRPGRQAARDGAGGAPRECGSGRRLLPDRGRAGRARDLVLRAGAAGAADAADDPAVLDQRDAAARGDDVVERQDVLVVRLLQGVLEHPGRPPELDRGARLVLRDRDRGELGAVHAQERDQVGAGVDDRDVQRPAAPLGLGHRGLGHRLRPPQRDRRAVGRVEGHRVGDDVERAGGRGGRLLGLGRTADEGGTRHDADHRTLAHGLILHGRDRGPPPRLRLFSGSGKAAVVEGGAGRRPGEAVCAQPVGRGPGWRGKFYGSPANGAVRAPAAAGGALRGDDLADVGRR